MTRFILDTGIAGLYLDRNRGGFERGEPRRHRRVDSRGDGDRRSILQSMLEGSPKLGF